LSVEPALNSEGKHRSAHLLQVLLDGDCCLRMLNQTLNTNTVTASLFFIYILTLCIIGIDRVYINGESISICTQNWRDFTLSCFL